MELYCYQDYLDIFVSGKTYKGEKVYDNNNGNTYIKVFMSDNIQSRYFKLFSDSPFLSNVEDHFMSIEDWREKQIREVIL